MNLHNFASNFYSLVKIAEAYVPENMENAILKMLDEISYVHNKNNKFGQTARFLVRVDLSGLPEYTDGVKNRQNMIKSVLEVMDVLLVSANVYPIEGKMNILGSFSPTRKELNINLFLPKKGSYEQWQRNRNYLISSTIKHELIHMVQFLEWAYDRSLEMNEHISKYLIDNAASFTTLYKIKHLKQKNSDKISEPKSQIELDYQLDHEMEAHIVSSLQDFKTKFVENDMFFKSDIKKFLGIGGPVSCTDGFFATLYNTNTNKWRTAVKEFLTSRFFKSIKNMMIQD